MCFPKLLLAIYTLKKLSIPSIAIFKFPSWMFGQLCKSGHLFHLVNKLSVCIFWLFASYFEGFGLMYFPYISVTRLRVAKQRTGEGLDLLSNLPSTSLPPPPQNDQCQLAIGWFFLAFLWLPLQPGPSLIQKAAALRPSCHWTELKWKLKEGADSRPASCSRLFKCSIGILSSCLLHSTGNQWATCIFVEAEKRKGLRVLLHLCFCLFAPTPLLSRFKPPSCWVVADWGEVGINLCQPPTLLLAILRLTQKFTRINLLFNEIISKCHSKGFQPDVHGQSGSERYFVVEKNPTMGGLSLCQGSHVAVDRFSSRKYFWLSEDKRKREWPTPSISFLSLRRQ